MKRFEFLLLLALSLWASGCQYILGGVEIKAAQTAVEPPSNVSAYLSVMNGQKPVTDLSARDFKLYENGEPLSPGLAKQTLLNASEVADHRTLVLLDMGAATGAQAVSRGAALLVSRLVAQQGVIVYAFDGSAELHLVGEFDKTFDRTATPEEFEELTHWKPTPGYRDLNGAVVAAVGRLKNALSASSKPVRVGTLVVFARGRDAAGKVSTELRDEAVTASGFDVRAISVQSDDPEFDLGALGPDGVQTTKTLEDIAVAFEQMASQLVARTRSYYLLSYCSPSRAGTRKLTVEVSITDPDGTEQRGSWSLDFDSTGFSPGCDATTIPRFGRVATPLPPSPEEPAAPTTPTAEEPPPEVVEAPPAASAPQRPITPRTAAPLPPPSTPQAPAMERGSEDAVVPPPAGGGYAPIEE